jgi:diguanylate cyclase (GGDEF)-like protein/PAS domain S-box-containing protein
MPQDDSVPQSGSAPDVVLKKNIQALQQQLCGLEEYIHSLSSSEAQQLSHVVSQLADSLQRFPLDHPEPSGIDKSKVRQQSSVLSGSMEDLGHNSDAHVVTGPTLVIDLGNQAACRLFQREHDQFIQTNLIEYLPREEHDRLWGYVHALEQGGAEAEWETKVHSPEGTHIVVLLTISALRDQQGRLKAIHWIFRDLREQQRATGADQLVKHIGEQILDGLTIHQILPIICEQLVDMFGYPVVWIGLKEDSGKIRTHMSAGAQAPILQNLLTRWDEGKPEEHPLTIALETGGIQILTPQEPSLESWFQWAKPYNLASGLIVPLYSRGEVLGVLGVFASVPHAFERKIVEWFEHVASQVTLSVCMAKDQDNLRLRGTAIAIADNAVYITDRTGRIEWVNDAYSRLTGFSATETIGQIAPFLKSSKMKAALKSSRAGRSRSQSWRNELDDQRKDGKPLTLEQVVTPLRDNNGDITHFVAVHQDITTRKESEARIFHLAHHDPLTDLPNRVMFHDRLKQAVAQAHRRGQSLAVIFLDLDHFKPINDSLGHDKGDELLKLVASILTHCVRETDTVSRLSGDEFTLVLQDLERGQDAGHVAQKILHAIAQPMKIADQMVTTTASVGIAVYPFDATNPEALLAQADRAMYRAKEKGGHCYQFVSQEMNAQAFERLMLEKSLRHAWERQEFLLHFQPEVDLRTGAITGLEALLRWQHPELGLIFPGQFMAMAQEIQMMDDIHNWVLLNACQQSRAWQQDRLPFGPIGINVLLGPWESDEVMTVINNALKQTQLEPSHLRIEIPQSVFWERQKDAVALVKKMQLQGISVVIDDFCPMPSILRLIERLPIHTVKISQALILNLPQDKEACDQVRQTIEYGQQWNVRVMAKGVESAEQVWSLRELGCHEIQGYLCNRPIPADEMTALLRGWWASEY